MLRLVLVLLLAVTAGWAEEKPFFFVQLADPQFGMFTNSRGFEQETANFEFVVATINRLKPVFVVVCGDLVQTPGYHAEIAEYQRIAAKVDPSIPVYNVAGNHDVKNEPTAASVSAYRTRFGRIEISCLMPIRLTPLHTSGRCLLCAKTTVGLYILGFVESTG